MRYVCLTTAPPTTLRLSVAISGALCRRREDEYETGTAPPTGTDVKLEKTIFVSVKSFILVGSVLLMLGLVSFVF